MQGDFKLLELFLPQPPIFFFHSAIVRTKWRTTHSFTKRMPPTAPLYIYKRQVGCSRGYRVNPEASAIPGDIQPHGRTLNAEGCHLSPACRWRLSHRATYNEEHHWGKPRVSGEALRAPMRAHALQARCLDPCEDLAGF